MARLVSPFTLLFLLVLSSVNGFLAKDTPFRVNNHKILLSATAGQQTTAMPEVKVGDKIPAVDMMEGLGGFEKQTVNIAELIAGRKVAIFGVPGAFTPGVFPKTAA